MKSRQTALLIIRVLGAFMFLGLGGTIYLVATGSDAASVATVAGLTGTALGGMTGLLAKTETDEGGKVD